VFKRSPSLAEQVKFHLKQRILDTDFDKDRIPSETVLAQELNVSRNTVRDALSRLEMEGIIIRRQGAGTFVNRNMRLIKTRLEEIIPYEEMIRAHGCKPAVNLLSVKQMPPDEQCAAQLNLNADDDVLSIKKLFGADGRPVIYSITYIPTKIIVQPYTNEDTVQPVYHFLPRFCRQTFAYYLSDIVPLVAAHELRQILHLPPRKSALLSFEEIGFNQDNEPVIKAISYFRDDLLRLRLIRRNTG